MIDYCIGKLKKEDVYQIEKQLTQIQIKLNQLFIYENSVKDEIALEMQKDKQQAQQIVNKQDIDLFDEEENDSKQQIQVINKQSLEDELLEIKKDTSNQAQIKRIKQQDIAQDLLQEATNLPQELNYSVQQNKTEQMQEYETEYMQRLTKKQQKMFKQQSKGSNQLGINQNDILDGIVNQQQLQEQKQKSKLVTKNQKNKQKKAQRKQQGQQQDE